MHDWLAQQHACRDAQGNVSYCCFILDRTKRKKCCTRSKVALLRMTEDLKSTASVSRCYRSSSDWQWLPRCQFHNDISIPLYKKKKSAPSNFRRHWIKSLSAVEVRQRLVWGSKTITSGQLTSSEPGEENWLAEGARPGRGDRKRRAGRLRWPCPRGKQDRGERGGHGFPECVTYMKSEKVIHRHLCTFMFF